MYSEKTIYNLIDLGVLNIKNIDKFKELFSMILTDNGSEFSNLTEIEFDMNTGEERTNASSYDMFSTIYGKNIIDMLGLIKIEPNDVNLSKSLILSFNSF